MDLFLLLALSLFVVAISGLFVVASQSTKPKSTTTHTAVDTDSMRAARLAKFTTMQNEEFSDCSHCRKLLPHSAFSTAQLKKPQVARRCKECVAIDAQRNTDSNARARASRPATRRPNAGWTEAWKEAAKVGDTVTLQRMIAHGQPIDAQQEFGFTALHIAAANEQPAAVLALLNAGADATLRSLDSHPSAHLASITPLQLAQWHGRTAVIELLTASSGEDPEETRAGVEAHRARLTAAHEEERHDALKADQVMMHAFEWKWAAQNGDVASLRQQLKHGQFVNQRNICGLTALHFAATDGNEAAVEFLLSQGADATMRSYPEEALPNMTPLQMSEANGSARPGGRVWELLRAAESRLRRR